MDLALSSPLALIASNFFITAVGLPFEVGKTLLQVEYRPRARFAPPEAEVKKDWGAEDDNLSNPDEADVYFSDRLEAPSQSFTPPPPPKADASGYLSDRESKVKEHDLSSARSLQLHHPTRSRTTRISLEEMEYGV